MATSTNCGARSGRFTPWPNGTRCWHGWKEAATRSVAVRAAETRDNQHQVERLIALNPEDHRYRYEIMSTDMPVDHYVGDFSARPEGGQHSTVIWSADFEVTAGDETEVASMVRRFLA
ncbi:SRPBCC family protein, partial [Mycolicibacterium sp.]|uniref:SRPBCC family protein n=1 Tax=Mycolicibacterium sp. TaxID=2320850 RepID=UPI0037C857CA